MEQQSWEALFRAEEERVRRELTADAQVDRDRKQSVERLRELYGSLLLRYNASHADDPLAQAAAESLTLVAEDQAELLLAVRAAKEHEKKKVNASGVIGLLLGLVFCLIAALIIRTYFIPGCACMLAGLLSAFIGGRALHGERNVNVRAEVDPELVWRTSLRTASTMDRRIEALSALPGRQSASADSHSFSPLPEDELILLGELLEAERSDNGDYALRQLRKLAPYLEKHQIRQLDYEPAVAEYFDVLPSRKGRMTLRPALFIGEKLLLPGRATEKQE